MKYLIHLIFLGLLCPTIASAGIKQLFNSNFYELNEVYNSEILHNAKSVGAMINKSNIVISNYNSKYIRIENTQLASKGYCSDFPLIKQPSVSKCTGFLVSKTHLVTARHCVDKIDSCENFSWMFNLKYNNSNKLRSHYRQNQVYNCKSISTKRSPFSALITDLAESDLAIVELDRPVTGISPLKMAKNLKGLESRVIYSIGHPLGTAAKFHGGQVKGVFTNSNFYTDQVVLPGSSGSPIIDVQSNTVIGVISKSAEFLRYNSNKQCIDFNLPAPTSLYKENLYSAATNIRKAAKLLNRLQRRNKE